MLQSHFKLPVVFEQCTPYTENTLRRKGIVGSPKLNDQATGLRSPRASTVWRSFTMPRRICFSPNLCLVCYSASSALPSIALVLYV